MDDAGSFGSFGGFGDEPQPYVSHGKHGGGGWHVLLTVLSLVCAAASAMLMAYLTRDVDQRSALVLGITFALPAAALMLAAMLLESVTSAMNPSYTRKAQAGVAIAAIVECFIVGCFGEVTSGFTIPKPQPVARYSYVILLDKSGSMESTLNYKTYDSSAKEAVSELIGTFEDNTNVGVVVFTHRIITTLPIQPLNADTRAQIDAAISEPTSGATDFYLPIQSALELCEDAGITGNVRFLFITDGGGSEDMMLSTEEARCVDQCVAKGITVSSVRIGRNANVALAGVIDATGGMNLSETDMTRLTGAVMTASQYNAQPVVVTDVVRKTAREGWHASEGSTWITTVMMVLEGVILGAALSLMLSRQGQKRFQMILSPICGIVAAFVLSAGFLPVQDWIREGAAFTLYGIVLMKKNR